MVNQYSQDFSKSTDSFKSRRGGAEWWSGECPISKKIYTGAANVLCNTGSFLLWQRSQLLSWWWLWFSPGWWLVAVQILMIAGRWWESKYFPLWNGNRITREETSFVITWRGFAILIIMKEQLQWKRQSNVRQDMLLLMSQLLVASKPLQQNWHFWQLRTWTH